MSEFVPGSAPHVMVCFGTRPEVVKLAPVIAALGRRRGVRLTTVSTGQHREMLDQMLATFALAPSLELAVHRPGQSLADLTGSLVVAMGRALETERPDAVLVQGDTTTAFASGLAAFYAGVPVGHVEAGLRTGDLGRPFPEEANRRLVAVLARWHWCPTARNAAALAAEGIDPAAVAVTGNTVIDALLDIARRPLPQRLAAALPPRRAARRILVTMHRRETLGAEQAALCRMLGEVVAARDVEIVFPVHLNPRVREQVEAELAGREWITLLDPLDYHSFVHLLASSDIAVTDSGGIQEEAPVFGIPVVVMRDATERVEGIEAGAIRLSGTDPERVRADILDLCDRAATVDAPAVSPYGDGRAAERIVEQLLGDLAGAPVPEPEPELVLSARSGLPATA